MEAEMPDEDRDTRTMRQEPLEGRMQVDPMLRQDRLKLGWIAVIAAAVVLFLVVLLATNRDGSDVATAPPAQPPVTTGQSGPMPPETQPNSARGTADAPPASTDATRVPAKQAPTGRETTGGGP
jgi:hypothetical protein